MSDEERQEEEIEATEEAVEAASEDTAAEAVAEEVDAAAEPVAEETSEAPAAEEAAEAPKAEKPAKPAIPGADLDVDLVFESSDEGSTGAAEYYEEDGDIEGEEEEEAPEENVVELKPITEVSIDLGKDARYRSTGKRKTSIARVILKPGKGVYTINGRDMDTHFPRKTLQTNISEPLVTVGYSDKIDVVAKIHGGGISSQAGALRHGISRALIVADPNLRSELKKRGFLTRDSRVKERRKAGLKKARKRPQFSKR